MVLGEEMNVKGAKGILKLIIRTYIIHTTMITQTIQTIVHITCTYSIDLQVCQKLLHLLSSISMPLEMSVT